MLTPRHARSIQNMGAHVMLDFHDVTRVDLRDASLIESIFDSALTKTDCNVCNKCVKVFPNGQVSIIYLLSESHMSYHSWPDDKCATVDFYNCGANSRLNCKTIEEELCNAFGWETCSSNIMLNRGTDAKLMANAHAHKTDILKGLRAISRTKSQFQDIRVYESKDLGRTLVIDGQVQMCNGLDDNYSRDMVENIIQHDTDYEHILIIGGGDLKIVNYLCTNYPLIKQITLCEIDPMVLEITECYFPELKLTDQMKEKVRVIHSDGNEFLRDNSDVQYDAIIVDCSDVCADQSLSQSLFSNEFYKKIISALKPGALFSQMLTIDEVKTKFMSMVERNGPNCSIDFVITETPEFGSSSPIGIVGVPRMQ